MQPVKTKKKLSRADKKQIEAAIARANRTDKKGKSAQDSIPYERMWPDGICRVSDSHYTKTIQFQDINYQLSQNEDKTAIFEGWCDFLNYFDSSIHFQLSFLNLAASEETFANSISVEFSAWKQEYTLLLKGQMSHRATLGIDPRGNLTRIDNALAQMPQRLEAVKNQLENLYQQQAAAKEEVGKPFLYEEELRSKNARLVELDTLLNIDGKGQAHTESVVAKSTRPSVLDTLKRPVQPRSTDKKPKQHEEVR